MRLTEFGVMARTLRMKFDVSLKNMADAMSISSAHLSGIEYGDKKLNESHIDAAAIFFMKHGASQEDTDALRSAGGRSLEILNVKGLNNDAREMVYAFARRLQDGAPPNEEINQWLKGLNKM